MSKPYNMKIRNIVFDFGGVLVDWNPRYYYRNYFNDDAKMEYFLANVCNDKWGLENDRGRTYAEGIRELTPKFPEYREAIELYPAHWPEMLKGDKPESVALLRQLHDEKADNGERRFRLYGLTNWSAENIHIAFERFDFLSLLEGTVVSGIEKMAKPDPGIYRLLLSRYGLKAEESVFIDDREENVEAARQLGFNGIVFVSADDTRRQLDAMSD